MLFWIVFVACSTTALLSAAEEEEIVRYDGHQVMKVLPKTERQARVLHELHQRQYVDLWTELRALGDPVLLRIAPSYIDQVTRNLTRERVWHNVTIKNLQSVFDEEKKMFTPELGKMLRASYILLPHREIDLTRYHTLEEIYQYMDRVLVTYKYLASPITAGTTHEGRPIRGIKLTASSSPDQNKDVILMEFGIHAREWIAPAAGVYIIHQLTNAYHSDSKIKDLLNKYEFVIIPVANPDGYVYTQKVRLWRKNRAPNMMRGCIGTDLNRNFEVEFGEGWPELRQPCDDLYSGDFAFSEKETQGLRDLMLSLRSRLKIYFAVHAFSQYWMYPYAYTKDPPPNLQELSRISQAGVKAIKDSHGLKFKEGTIAHVIYEASGSSVDWAYIKAGVKLAFALELRDHGTYGFALPRNQILPACEETWAGIQAAIEAV